MASSRSIFQFLDGIEDIEQFTTRCGMGKGKRKAPQRLSLDYESMDGNESRGPQIDVPSQVSS